MSSAPQPPQPPPLPSGRQPWRFSMRTMMLTMTAIAVFCGVAAALPIVASHAILGLGWIVATGWLVTGIIFAKQDERAFCIGAAIVTSSMWTGIGGRFVQGISGVLRLLLAPLESGIQSSFELWLVHFALFLTAIGNGYLCIFARRYFERQHDETGSRSPEVM